MGLNDLQSQINRLASKTSRQEDIIRDLQTKVSTAEQHAATPQQNLNSWAGAGGGGGGGNQPIWGRLTTNLEYTEDSSAVHEGVAVPQSIDADTGALLEGAASSAGEATVGVFTMDKHSSFSAEGTRVPMVKDDEYTAFKETDYYRIIKPQKGEIYVRLKVTPEANGEHSWLGSGATFRIYDQYEFTSDQEDNTPYLWKTTGGYDDNLDGTEVRFRTGFMLNTKDLYRATFWPQGGTDQRDLLIVEDVACIMARVGDFTGSENTEVNRQPPAGSVGCFSWSEVRVNQPTVLGWGTWYPMGKRRNIVGQFKLNVAGGATIDSGKSAAFMLGKWDKTTPPGITTVDPGAGDFEQDSVYGAIAPYGDGGGPSGYANWNIEFAPGAVYNAMNFAIKGHGTFGDSDADMVACQYDEERGVYLAAPLRCTE